MRMALTFRYIKMCIEIDANSKFGIQKSSKFRIAAIKFDLLAVTLYFIESN